MRLQRKADTATLDTLAAAQAAAGDFEAATRIDPPRNRTGPAFGAERLPGSDAALPQLAAVPDRPTGRGAASRLRAISGSIGPSVLAGLSSFCWGEVLRPGRAARLGLGRFWRLETGGSGRIGFRVRRGHFARFDFGFLDYWNTVAATRFPVPKFTSFVTPPFSKHLEIQADSRAGCSKKARIHAAWVQFQNSTSKNPPTAVIEGVSRIEGDSSRRRQAAAGHVREAGHAGKLRTDWRAPERRARRPLASAHF